MRTPKSSSDPHPRQAACPYVRNRDAWNIFAPNRREDALYRQHLSVLEACPSEACPSEARPSEARALKTERSGDKALIVPRRDALCVVP